MYACIEAVINLSRSMFAVFVCIPCCFVCSTSVAAVEITYVPAAVHIKFPDPYLALQVGGNKVRHT